MLCRLSDLLFNPAVSICYFESHYPEIPCGRGKSTHAHHILTSTSVCWEFPVILVLIVMQCFFPHIVCIQDVDFSYLARLTKGFSGADLTEICQRVRSVWMLFEHCGYALFDWLWLCRLARLPSGSPQRRRSGENGSTGITLTWYDWGSARIAV